MCFSVLGILALLNRDSRVLTIQPKNTKISFKSQMDQLVHFLLNPFGNDKVPQEVVSFFRSAFPYHLLNFPVSSLSSTETNHPPGN